MLKAFFKFTRADLVKSITVVITYLALQHLGGIYLHASPTEWRGLLACGVGLAVLITDEKRYLPSVLLGAFLANYSLAVPPLTAAALAITHGGALYWAASQLRGLNNFICNLQSLSQYRQLVIFGAVLASGCSALSGAAIYLITAENHLPESLTEAGFGWLTESLSILILTPLVLSGASQPFRLKKNFKAIAKTIFALAIVALTGQLLFFAEPAGSAAQLLKNCLIWPVMIWIALHVGTATVALALLLLSIQGLIGIHDGSGGLGNAAPWLSYWIYMTIMALASMSLSIYVNERKQIELALLDSHNHFKTLINNTSILVWLSGLNKRYYYFNQVWLDFTGRTLAQELGDGWVEGIHQEDLRYYLDTYVAAFAAQQPFTVEYRLLCVDGSYHWMLDHGAPRFDEQGEFLGYIGTLIDISSRKYAEQALSLRTRELALQNQLLKQISSGSSLDKLLTELAKQLEILLPGCWCSIMLVDQEARRMLLHCAAPRLPGYYNKALHGMAIAEGVASCGTAAYRGERVIITQVQKHPYWQTYRALTAQLGIESCWSEPVLNSQGRVLGTLNIYYRQAKTPSVNETALLERYANLAELIIEHKQSETALQESEERLRLVLEGSELGFWDWQIKQNIVQRNAIWAEILGYEPQQIGNDVEKWLDLIHPEDRQRALQSVKAILNADSEIHDLEYRMIHRDGSIRWIQDHAKVVEWDAQGRPTRMCGTQADITKIKQAEEELRIAAIAFESQEGMFVTDANSIILRINQSFTKISGYTEADTLGRTPRLFQSGIQKPGFYHDMWEQLKRTGEWQGEIWNRRKSGDVYPAWLTITAVKNSRQQVSHYVATLTDITARKLAEEKIAKLAFYDSLTHLPNRRLLMEHLDHCIAVTKRDSKQMAVLMLDLDRFKAVNDSLGHQAGDQLLQQVAKRLSSRLRDVDMVARLGGDEFIVILDDIKNPEDAGQVAENIVEDLSAPFQLLQSNDVRIGVSVGISLCPEHSDSPELLMEQADVALYQAKNKGRGRFAYFSETLAAGGQDRSILEKRLSRAIEQQELRLVYQAQVDMRTDRIIGAEVLVRWKNPVDGLTPLHRFITIAEESGLIIPIGEWVLRETCRQGRLWLDHGFAPLSLAVNISPLQFQQADLSQMIAAILAETGFPAHCLVLEIRESALAGNKEQQALRTVNQLHRQGVRLAVDNFGVGQYSLASLSRFPIEILKIDKRFIEDLGRPHDKSGIALSIITMGRSLGYTILAEGVETQEQLNLLRAKGCDIYQGYVKSRPLPAEAFAELIKVPPEAPGKGTPPLLQSPR